MRISSTALFLAACGQLLLLAITFGDTTQLQAVMLLMPDVCRTHAGAALLGLCLSAACLTALTCIAPANRPATLSWPLVLACLALHGATGHASDNGILSLAEALQWLHLLAMAVWSGGVLVSGIIARSLNAPPELLRRYLGCLSTTSTWAVGLVLLSGVAKAYRATGGSIPLLRTTEWGHALTIKAILVTLTLLLGARNRWLLAAPDIWNPSTARKAVLTLQAEACCMGGVLLLSAWLANLSPPLE